MSLPAELHVFLDAQDLRIASKKPVPTINDLDEILTELESIGEVSPDAVKPRVRVQATTRPW